MALPKEGKYYCAACKCYIQNFNSVITNHLNTNKHQKNVALAADQVKPTTTQKSNYYYEVTKPRIEGVKLQLKQEIVSLVTNHSTEISPEALNYLFGLLKIPATNTKPVEQDSDLISETITQECELTTKSDDHGDHNDS